MSSKLDYQKGLQKMSKDVLPQMKVSKQAFELMSELFNDLNQQLVGETKSNFKATRSDRGEAMTEEHAQMAVKKVLKFKIRDYAIAEGQKSVFKYTNKLLRFNENAAKTEIARAFRMPPKPQLEASMFHRGLTELVAWMYQDVALNLKAKRLIAAILYNTSKSLSKAASTVAVKKQDLSENDVSSAVKRLFTSTMWEYAHAYGMNNVQLYTSGMLRFKPKNKYGSRQNKGQNALSSSATDSWIQQHRQVFVPGIKKLGLQVQNTCHLDRTSLIRTSAMLSTTLYNLASVAMNAAIREHRSELDVSAIETAINSVFPRVVGTHARSEANRCLTLFHNGLIQFTPRRARKRPLSSSKNKRASKRRKKSLRGSANAADVEPAMKKKPTVVNFTGALRKLLAEIHEMGSFNRAAGEKLNGLLQDLLRKLIDASVVKASSNVPGTLDAQDVGEAVKELFSGSLQDHALSEGSNAVVLYSNEGGKQEERTSEPQTDETFAASTEIPVAEVAPFVVTSPDQQDQELPEKAQEDTNTPSF